MRRSNSIAKSARALVGAAALAVAAGCAAVISNHGYAPTDEQLAGIEPGIDTARSVSLKIGRPSTGGIIRDDTWYYVATRFETMTYNAPEVTERKVIAVSFTTEGVVTGVERYGLEDGRVINLVTRTTPTFGREMTALQQIFGNIGNVNSESVTDAGPFSQ